MTGNTNPVGNPVITRAQESIGAGVAKDSESEFERFEDLTRKLVSTPKGTEDKK
jgi:hypothetical protein